jgi:accessory gene regulator protein AgrB
MKMEQTECSETSAFKLQTPGNYPKESVQHIEHGESLKSRSIKTCVTLAGILAIMRMCFPLPVAILEQG